MNEIRDMADKMTCSFPIITNKMTWNEISDMADKMTCGFPIIAKLMYPFNVLLRNEIKRQELIEETTIKHNTKRQLLEEANYEERFIIINGCVIDRKGCDDDQNKNVQSSQ